MCIMVTQEKQYVNGRISASNSKELVEKLMELLEKPTEVSQITIDVKGFVNYSIKNFFWAEVSSCLDLSKSCNGLCPQDSVSNNLPLTTK